LPSDRDEFDTTIEEFLHTALEVHRNALQDELPSDDVDSDYEEVHNNDKQRHGGGGGGEGGAAGDDADGSWEEEPVSSAETTIGSDQSVGLGEMVDSPNSPHGATHRSLPPVTTYNASDEEDEEEPTGKRAAPCSHCSLLRIALREKEREVEEVGQERDLFRQETAHAEDLLFEAQSKLNEQLDLSRGLRAELGAYRDTHGGEGKAAMKQKLASSHKGQALLQREMREQQEDLDECKRQLAAYESSGAAGSRAGKGGESREMEFLAGELDDQNTANRAQQNEIHQLKRRLSQSLNSELMPAGTSPEASYFQEEISRQRELIRTRDETILELRREMSRLAQAGHDTAAEVNRDYIQEMSHLQAQVTEAQLLLADRDREWEDCERKLTHETCLRSEQDLELRALRQEKERLTRKMSVSKAENSRAAQDATDLQAEVSMLRQKVSKEQGPSLVIITIYGQCS